MVNDAYLRFCTIPLLRLLHTSFTLIIAALLPLLVSCGDTTSRTVNLTDPSDPLSLTSLTESVSVNGKTYSSTFVKSSLTRSATSPMGRVSATTLDSTGKPVSVTMAGLSPVSYGYDARGRLSSVSQGSRSSNYAYDSSGFLSSVTDPLGRVTLFGYDAAGRVLSQTMPDGRSVAYTYDANGNVTSITPPGRSAHVFAYTPVDLEQSYDPPDVGLATDITRYEYNLDKDLTRIIRPDGQQVDYGYDSGGRLTTVTAPDSLIAYTYGAAGCTSCGGGDLPASVSRTDSQGQQNIAYSYDGSLLLTSTWSGPVAGVVARTYDNDFRVSSWSVNGGTAITQTYDADGALTKAGELNLAYNASTGFLTGVSLGVTSDAYQYSGYGETASYAATAASQEVYKVSYTRDSLGRIESENEVVEGVSTLWTYRYDAAGRLIEVLKDGASWSVYRYDPNGNRVEAATQSGLVNGTYDAQDRLLTYGNFAYEYTANGELKTKTDTVTGQITRYTYDVFGNLTRVDLPDGRVIEYVIDGANRRVGKKINSVFVKGWLYKDSLKPIAELDGSGNVVATFVYGSKYNVPDYVIKGGATYRVVSDHLGSPRLIVNSASGAIVSQMEYDEFGNVLADKNPEFTPFGFAGGLYDSDTGLIRFGARDYDPAVGRWTTKDPIMFNSGDVNLFGYVRNNPVNFNDPFGLFENPFNYWPEFLKGAEDFARKYQDMREANTVGADKYFHCMANCQAARKGLGGRNAAEAIGEGREAFDKYIKGDSDEECNADRAANSQGRNSDTSQSCRDACGSLRPYGLDPQW